MTSTPLESIRHLIIDMDGVLYRGNRLMPGADRLLPWLDQHGIKYVLVTNNSTRTPSQYAEKLRRMGLVVSPGLVLTSSQATASYLQRVAEEGDLVYCIGEDGLRQALAQAGFGFSEVDPSYIVVGLDTGFTYEKLKRACLAIRAGAGFIATNPDLTFPGEEGILPGCGSLIAAIQACTGVAPKVIGKPEPGLLQAAMDMMASQAENTAILGDRLDTDVLGGHRLGITTILILSGVSRPEDAASATVKPDYVFWDLPELMRSFSAPAVSPPRKTIWRRKS